MRDAVIPAVLGGLGAVGCLYITWSSHRQMIRLRLRYSAFNRMLRILAAQPWRKNRTLDTKEPTCPKMISATSSTPKP